MSSHDSKDLMLDDTVMSTCALTCFTRSIPTVMQTKDKNFYNNPNWSEHFKHFSGKEQICSCDPFSLVVFQAYIQTDKGQEFVSNAPSFPNWAKNLVGVSCRTRYIDDRIKELTKTKDISQIVFLGVGMDGRSFRLDCLKNVTVFELDQDTVINTREAVINSEFAKNYNLSQKCQNRISVKANLSYTWSDKLLESGFNTNLPTIWITEGLLLYLSQNVCNSILKDCAALSCNKNSYMLGLDINTEFLHMAQKSSNAIMKSWLSSMPNDLDKLNDFGWQVDHMNTLGCIDPEYEMNFGLLNPPAKKSVIVDKFSDQRYFISGVPDFVLYMLSRH